MKILLHICCGVCASSVIETLKSSGHEVTGFFYDPNIHPIDEYKKRLKAAEMTADALGIELVEGSYDDQDWFRRVKGKEHEPERGARCEVCFAMRLEKTYEHLLKNGFSAFTTTLTVSPFKDAAQINAVGRRIGGDSFIAADFKKKDGFKRAQERAREWDLYRQHYCGCVYSRPCDKL